MKKAAPILASIGCLAAVYFARFPIYLAVFGRVNQTAFVSFPESGTLLGNGVTYAYLVGKTRQLGPKPVWRVCKSIDKIFVETARVVSNGKLDLSSPTSMFEEQTRGGFKAYFYYDNAILYLEESPDYGGSPPFRSACHSFD